MINRNMVLNACEILSDRLTVSTYLPRLLELGIDKERAEREIFQAKEMLSREWLEEKLRLELGEYLDEDGIQVTLPDGNIWVKKAMPLGTLLHIGAGNVYGLSAFSVIEGLLTGNVNYVKLPHTLDSVSVFLLRELVAIEPSLQEYIHVYATPSKDKEQMECLAGLADGIVVWGADETVSAVRRLAKPGTRLIEWGHKLSFAYVTEEGMSDRESLERLADHICESNQLSCSSCQGIYLDTCDMGKAEKFAAGFLKVLENACLKNPHQPEFRIQGQITLMGRVKALEQGNRVLQGNRCGVMVEEDNELKPSFLYRNVWVKCLEREKIKQTLSKHRHHTHTIGLLCGRQERADLTDKLLAAGAVRICDGGRMSKIYSGLPHDGEYPLRRYVKIVSIEFE